MKRVLLAFISAFLLLTGCGDKKEKNEYFNTISGGEKIYLSYDNYDDFLSIKLSYSVKNNVLSYTLSTSGYSVFSYFIDGVVIKTKYQYLGDDGNYSTATFTISSNPDQDGNSINTDSKPFYYRDASDLGVFYISVDGFVVKKK